MSEQLSLAYILHESYEHMPDHEQIEEAFQILSDPLTEYLVRRQKATFLKKRLNKLPRPYHLPSLCFWKYLGWWWFAPDTAPATRDYPQHPSDASDRCDEWDPDDQCEHGIWSICPNSHCQELLKEGKERFRAYGDNYSDDYRERYPAYGDNYSDDYQERYPDSDYYSDHD
jgi:hypothetical protein